MKAMVLNQKADLEKNRNPLALMEVPVPEPKTGEILAKVLRMERP